MTITRRKLIVLAGAFALAGCAQSDPESADAFAPVAGGNAPVDAGPLTDFPSDGVYDRFRRSHGFFVIREGRRIFAQSSVCTHRNCLLWGSGSVSGGHGGFVCKCHGSTFTLDGKVLRGPARRDLPRFAVERDANNHLIVYPGRRLRPEESDSPSASVLLW